MSLVLPQPIIYLITNGETTSDTNSASPEFTHILELAKVAVDSSVPFIQIREKELKTRVLFDLATRVVKITSGTRTRLLINDRSDVAAAAGADGVQLTSHSLPTDVVRKTFGNDFIIGVSTHSVSEAERAKEAGANFVIYGPVFATESKRVYGAPQGLSNLRELTVAVGDFPVIAIGGITLENFNECLRAGARGVAAIGLFRNVEAIEKVVSKIRQ